MAGALISGAISGLGTLGAAHVQSKAAKEQQRIGLDAAREAEDRYRQDVEQGIAESDAAYGEAQGYLKPMRDRGEANARLLDDITGLSGPDRQDNALAMYRSNPSSALLGTAREEAIRRTIGSSAAGGLSGSGSAALSLGRRLGDMDLADFYRWQANPQAMAGYGVQTNALAAQLAAQRGGSILGARSSIGAGGAAARLMAGNVGMAAAGLRGQAEVTALGQGSKLASNAFNQWWNKSPPESGWATTVMKG